MITKNQYHITQLPNLILSYILTKLLFSKARLIRLPIDLRGKKYMRFGHNLVTGRYCRIDCPKINLKDKNPELIIGNNVQINDRCHIACINKITIGDNVLIASNVFITDHDHVNTREQIDLQIPWSAQPLHSKPVLIEENVWIGENVIILKGVTIGKNSIIGAGSIVTKSVPQNSINAGAPNKILKFINQ